MTVDNVAHLLTAECTATRQYGSFYLNQLPQNTRQASQIQLNGRYTHTGSQKDNTGLGFSLWLHLIHLSLNRSYLRS